MNPPRNEFIPAQTAMKSAHSARIKHSSTHAVAPFFHFNRPMHLFGWAANIVRDSFDKGEKLLDGEDEGFRRQLGPLNPNFNRIIHIAASRFRLLPRPPHRLKPASPPNERLFLSMIRVHRAIFVCLWKHKSSFFFHFPLVVQPLSEHLHNGLSFHVSPLTLFEFSSINIKKSKEILLQTTC